MQLGMIGLGRMGGNIVRRLLRNGHQCVVYDRDAKVVQQLAGEGATGSTGLADFVSKLETPKCLWVMLPAGKITHDTIVELNGLLGKGDILIDGGNSKFLDDIAHAEMLAQKGITFVDVGTSGGVWGLERGYCMMIGGASTISIRSSRPWRRASARSTRRRAAAVAIRGSRTATSMPARPARAISPRWSTTAWNTASCRPMPKASIS